MTNSVGEIFHVRDGSARHKVMKKLYGGLGKPFPIKDLDAGALRVMRGTMKKHKAAFHFVFAGEGKARTVALKKGAG